MRYNVPQEEVATTQSLNVASWLHSRALLRFLGVEPQANGRCTFAFHDPTGRLPALSKQYLETQECSFALSWRLLRALISDAKSAACVGVSR